MRLTKEQQRLVEENHHLIYSFANKFNIDIEENYDLLAIALCEASISYESEKTKFITYAYRVMKNKYCNHIKSKSHQHNLMDKLYVDDERISQDNNVYFKDKSNKFEVFEMFEYLTSFFNMKEISILKLFFNGYNATEIAILNNTTEYDIKKLKGKLKLVMGQ